MPLHVGVALAICSCDIVHVWGKVLLNVACVMVLNCIDPYLQGLLIPVDPLDDRNIMLEVRAGPGGEEAALWAADLVRM